MCACYVQAGKLLRQRSFEKTVIGFVADGKDHCSVLQAVRSAYEPFMKTP